MRAKEFNDTKYTRMYYQIIDRAMTRNLPDSYFEKHHIIPSSVGGLNVVENLVHLTGREHFICHWLLTKMTSGKAKSSMVYALSMMRCISLNHEARYSSPITARVYESLKGQRIVSDETKAKMVKASIGRNVGRKASVESRLARSEARKGYVHSAETKKKIGAAHKGKVVSDETKEKIKEARRRQVISEETKKKMSETHKRRWAKERMK